MRDIETIIEAAFETRAEGFADRDGVRAAVDAAIDALDTGTARVAEYRDGDWHVNQWLKKAVLLSFGLNGNDVIDGGHTRYYDKVEFEVFRLHCGGFCRRRRTGRARCRSSGAVRLLPSDVVLMPSYVNIGARMSTAAQWSIPGRQSAAVRADRPQRAPVRWCRHRRCTRAHTGRTRPSSRTIALSARVRKSSKASSSSVARCCRWGSTSAKARASMTALAGKVSYGRVPGRFRRRARQPAGARTAATRSGLCRDRQARRCEDPCAKTGLNELLRSLDCLTMLTVYGIKSCDTCRRARKFFAEHDIEFRFHDVRDDGLDIQMLERWAARVDWQKLAESKQPHLAQAFPEVDRAGMNRDRAFALILENPTLMKRPVLEASALHCGRVLRKALHRFSCQRRSRALTRLPAARTCRQPMRPVM